MAKRWTYNRAFWQRFLLEKSKLGTTRTFLSSNPGFSPPAGKEITVVRRIYGSSSTSLISQYLHKVCPSDWDIGVGSGGAASSNPTVPTKAPDLALRHGRRGRFWWRFRRHQHHGVFHRVHRIRSRTSVGPRRSCLAKQRRQLLDGRGCRHWLRRDANYVLHSKRRRRLGQRQFVFARFGWRKDVANHRVFVHVHSKGFDLPGSLWPSRQSVRGNGLIHRRSSDAPDFGANAVRLPSLQKASPVSRS